MAILFAADQFHINWETRSITLPIIGEQSVSDIGEPYEPDWAALIPDKEGAEVTLILGVGSPYQTDVDNHLPRKDGRILAVPFWLGASTGSYPETRQQRRARKRASSKR